MKACQQVTLQVNRDKVKKVDLPKRSQNASSEAWKRACSPCQFWAVSPTKGSSGFQDINLMPPMQSHSLRRWLYWCLCILRKSSWWITCSRIEMLLVSSIHWARARMVESCQLPYFKIKLVRRLLIVWQIAFSMPRSQGTSRSCGSRNQSLSTKISTCPESFRPWQILQPISDN